MPNLLYNLLKKIFTWRKESCFYGILFLCLALNLSSQEAFRVWTDVKGRTVSAKYYKLSGSSVIIERESDKRKMSFPINQLSAADQDYIKNLKVAASSSMKSHDYQGILLRQKKWTNRISGSLQRFFFAFKLDKVDADGDGRPEGNKVIVQQLWFGGREAALNAKIIHEQVSIGSWTVDDSGRMEIDLGKCYPDPDARIGYTIRGDVSNFRYWIGAGYPPRTICLNKTAHPHTTSCGSPFQGDGVWDYDVGSNSFKGASSNDIWRASLYPLKTALEMK